MGQQKNWTKEDFNTLQDMWGDYSIPGIAKRLGRSVNAIKIKANRLGLESHINSGTLVSFCQLLKAIGQYQNYPYLKTRLLRDGFPVKMKRIDKCRFRMVDIDDFWEWTEKNKDAIDFSKFEKNMLGKEPDWVDAKRQVDWLNSRSFKTSKWTQSEDEQLLHLLGKYEYSYFQIAEKLRRTEGAVKRRLSTLGIKNRPVKEPPKLWQQSEIDILLELSGKGHSFEFIGQKLGRTGLACRSKLERLQKPEYFNRDNRRLREHFKQFFQKEQCEHWSKSTGCAMRASGCDECLSYKRKETN